MSKIQKIDPCLQSCVVIDLLNEKNLDEGKFSVADAILDAGKAQSSTQGLDLSSRVVEDISEQPIEEASPSLINPAQIEKPISPSSIRQKIKTAAFYALAAVASAVVVGFVILETISFFDPGVFYVDQRDSLIDQRSPFREGLDLKKEIGRLRRSGDSCWKDKAIALIERSRRDNPKEDLERLRGAGILDPLTERKLDHALDNTELLISTPLSVRINGQIHVKKLYGQALEIKKLYQDTFHVFLHAQASPWLPVSDLVKELWSAQRSQDDFRHFSPLRAPCSTASAGLMEATHRSLNAVNPFAVTGIGRFRDRWFQSFTLSDSDAKVREELLSVDAYFFNHYRYESSMFFLRNDNNILTRSSKIEEVAQKAIGHFNPSVSEGRSRYLARKVSRTNASNYPCGNLFVFCIPKEQSPEVQYRAHPFGLACQCHPREEDLRILEKLQRGQFDASTQCNPVLLPPSLPPQFRLYLPEVQPGTGKKVFLLTPLAAAERKKMQESIHAIAQQAARTRSVDTAEITKEA